MALSEQELIELRRKDRETRAVVASHSEAIYQMANQVKALEGEVAALKSQLARPSAGLDLADKEG